MKRALLFVFCLVTFLTYGQEGTSGKTEDVKGYENDDNLGGPKSIGRQLEVANNKYTFNYRYPIKYFKSWYDWKDKLNKEKGIKFGINYNAVYIRSSATLSDENNKNASSGILDIQGGWNLIGRKSGKNKGTLYVKFNSRHTYVKDQTDPMFHGLFESGYYGLPATGFRKYTFRMNEINWQQNLADNRVAFVVGKVDMTNYFNFHGLVIPWQHFLGYGASVSGTVNWGNQGLGGVVSFRPTENLYVMGGAVDVYGDLYADGKAFDFGNNFQNGNLMYLGEVGYVGSFEERYFKKISLTYWSSDSYVNPSGTAIGHGHGMAFSSHWFFAERFAPFFRFGISNGVGENAFYKKDIQIGHGLRFANYDMLGTSFSWNEPNIDGAKDQFTAEVFYRFNLSAHFEITPSAQLIVNPTFNPDQGSITYLGIRARATM